MLVNLIYTDGACEPNPGHGGWGFTVTNEAGATHDSFGGESQTTNNRMEMTAILQAMRWLPDGAAAKIHSDSRYCINGLTVWRDGWKRKNWMRKGGPMLNRDLWLALEHELARVKAKFVWVRGHNGDPGNERADELASIGRLQTMRKA